MTLNPDRMRRGNRRRLERGRWTKADVERIWRKATQRAAEFAQFVD